MKNTARLAAALLPLALVLSACEKTDTDLVLDFVNSWLESRGAMAKDENGNYKPTLKGVGVAMGFATTGDDNADAAMQAGKVTKDIADNDKLVREGEAALNKNPPDETEAKKKLDTAVSNRPDDWYYRNHRAFLNIRTGNDSAAQADFKAGMAACNGNQVCLMAMHKDRVNFYSSMQLGAFMSADANLRRCSVQNMGVESYQALADASTGSDKANYQSALQTAKEVQKQNCN